MTPNPHPSAGRWPPQVKYIVGNEACERFSYYGIVGILAGYITALATKGGLGMQEDDATEIIHFFKFANYFMPLFGAWLSDRLIGRYHTILWVSLIYCLGNGVLASSGFAHDPHGRLMCLCTGLALIAFGSGGIKPCVSAFMGDQFKPEQSHLLQKAYGAFYWSINFGSFFSFLVVPWASEKWNYAVAFGIPGVLMALATLIFVSGTRYYTRKPTNRETRHAGFFTVFWSAFRACPTTPWMALLNVTTTIGLPVVIMALMIWVFFSKEGGVFTDTLGWISLALVGVWYLLVIGLSVAQKTELPQSFLQYASPRHNESEIAAARSLSPILFIFAFIPVFWTLFDQTNSTWVMQGEQMIRYHLPTFPFPTVGGIGHWLHGAATTPFEPITLTVGAEEMQSANPAIVMILVPLFTLFVYPRIGKFASPLKRMSYGMFVAASSYLVVAALQKQVEAGAQLSVLIQFIPYLILTTAEVLLSTTGLEFAFREAAPEMKSAIMSFWLLTVSVGNLMVTTITKLFATGGAHEEASVSTGRFLQYAGLTFVVAILFSLVAAFYRYRDPAAAQGK
ncbi:MAG TPA: MFS transporter [Candidatus Acidoferrales bacterium]|nr:MFS transporter [Candidatus Acidoferrales bacterium]